MMLENGPFTNLFVLPAWESRAISAENPDGSKGGGARAVPLGGPARNLGVGWKVRPCVDLPAGGTVTLADIAGPGVIQHLWMTVAARAYRECVLRLSWDGEETPSVEVPLGDFFANGHGLRCNVRSLMVAVNPSGGFNCYWPMPFARRALLTVENQGQRDVKDFFYQVDYALGELPADPAYFHAQWRVGTTRREHPEHTLLDGVRGDGQYVGTYLAWTQFSHGWWGEGEVKFYLDGDGEFPTICGTGTEDYFGGAWGFGETFCGPFTGYPLWKRGAGRAARHGLYRWHVLDPIRFHRDLRVTVQALGWWPGGVFEPLTDEIASTAYWYQREPHAPFLALANET